MKMVKIISFLIAFQLIIYNVFSQASFVSRNQNQFILDGKPYYYIGTNYWYGGFLGLHKNKAKGITRLRKELDFLQTNGVTNLRVLTGVEGSGQINGVQWVQPTS